MPAAASLAHRLGTWLDRVAPRRCALCGAALEPGRLPGLCGGCLVALPGAATHRCLVCALPTVAGERWCGGCRADPPPFDLTLTAADYAPPLDRLVTSMKFGRRIALARPLGELLAMRLLGSAADCGEPTLALDGLVPVPLSSTRLAHRGFDQALEMARACADAVAAARPGRRLPVHRGWLQRSRDTTEQSSLDAQARSRNLDGAFTCEVSLHGLRIGLVDDVMTTGSTLAEASRMLKRAGAAAVVNLVAARTRQPAAPAPATA